MDSDRISELEDAIRDALDCLENASGNPAALRSAMVILEGALITDDTLIALREFGPEF